MKKYSLLVVALVLIVIGVIVVSLDDDKLIIDDKIIVNDFEGCVRAGNPVMESYPRQCRHEGVTYVEDIINDVQEYFAKKIDEKGIENLGAHPIEGFNPELYKMAFPGLRDIDFHETEAIGGIWKFENNELNWIKHDSEFVTSADGTLTNEGLNKLLENLENRLKIRVSNLDSIDQIIKVIQEKARNVCTGEQRNVDACITLYDPVCGWNNENIKCITWPCASTYSNGCFACQNPDVAYWTKGECPKPQ